MTVIFSLVIYGEKKLPDNMNAIETEIVFSGIYKATINSVLPVSKAINNSESLYCSDIKLFGAIPPSQFWAIVMVLLGVGYIFAIKHRLFDKFGRFLDIRKNNRNIKK